MARSLSGPSRLLPLFLGLAALTLALLLLADDSPPGEPLAIQESATNRDGDVRSADLGRPDTDPGQERTAVVTDRGGPLPVGAGDPPHAPPPDNRLRGRVVDGRDGTAIAGAQLILQRPEKGDTWSLDLTLTESTQELDRSESGTDGSFAFDVEPGRLHWLRVLRDGYAKRKITSGHGGSELLVELWPGAVLRGTVSLGDRPAEGVKVRGFRSGSGELFRTRTDARGFYELRDIHPGEVTVEVTSEHAASPPWQRLTFASGQELRHDVTLERGKVTRGRITDASTGLPIHGAVVGTGWTYRRTVRTDVDGRYELFGFPEDGVTELYARQPGFVEDFRWLADAPAEDGVLTVDFALQPGLSASGRVRDHQGLPVEGAWVAAIGGREIGPGSSGAHQVTARTDGNGDYVLQDLEPGRAYELVVRSRGFGHFIRPFPRVLETGESLHLDDAVLHPAGRIRGVVQDESGAPLAGLDVTLRLDGGADPHAPQVGVGKVAQPYADTLRTTTDALGSFHFTDLPAGVHGLAARQRGGLRAAIQVDLGVGEQRLDVVVELFLGAKITGTLLDADGQPVELATVEVFRVVSAGLLVDPPERIMRSSAQDGRFEIAGLRPGRYRLDWQSWRPPGPTWSTEAGAGDEGLVVRMPSIVALTGRVVGPDGAPRPGCWVGAKYPESSGLTAHTDQDGRFRLEIPPGQPVELSVYVPLTAGPDGHGGKLFAGELADPAAATGILGPRDDLELRLAR